MRWFWSFLYLILRNLLLFGDWSSNHSCGDDWIDYQESEERKDLDIQYKGDYDENDNFV